LLRYALLEKRSIAGIMKKEGGVLLLAINLGNFGGDV
jgi:hypothetical protein